MTDSRKLTIRSFEKISQFLESDNNADLYKRELALIEGEEDFLVPGYCYVCDKPSEFLVDFLRCPEVEAGKTRIPNWRERLVCPNCNLNNRMRAIVHIVEILGNADENTDIYITEQT